MFGQHGLFDDAPTDAWSERIGNSNTSNKNRFPDYSPAQPSLVARTLLPPDGSSRTNVVEKKPPPKKQEQRPAVEAPEETEPNYCEAYPNTNTNQVDWALYAAHRVANVSGIDLEKSKTLQFNERNLATIFFGKCNGERFKNDSRVEMLEKITLQGILLAIFLPSQLSLHLTNMSAQHSKLKLSARQCSTQIEQNIVQLSKRAAHERDLLIKRMLFHADNNQTECTFTIDSRVEFGKNEIQWSQYTVDSVSEADLFGRAIGVLVHQVLQSASLRVKAAANTDRNKIVLLLSWKSALDNLKADLREPVKVETKKSEKSEMKLVEKRQQYLPNPLFDDTISIQEKIEQFDLDIKQPQSTAYF